MIRIATKTLKRLSIGAVLVIAPLLVANEPLHKSSYQEIINKYLFVGDFSEKPDTRPVGDEVFWRYPISFPKIEFPLDYEDGPTKEAQMEKSFPATPGEGIPLHHVNQGRKLLLEGNFEEAKAVFLSARARYGDTYAYHRRNDYFLGYLFVHMALQYHYEKNLPWKHMDTKQLMENAATFLSWAFQMKRDIPDPFLDTVAPRAYYNLSAIYYQYDRYPPSYGAARDGLNFLRKTGRSDYRAKLRRILAESYIKNRSYLEAVQELDTALRQDATKTEAAEIFARVGDIYFDVNNFELAEDAYALANRVDQEVETIHPSQFALRGEALFWLGHFSEAQRMFHYALNSNGNKNSHEALNEDLMALASLRTADAWLARKDFEQAKLGYFKHSMEFRGHPTAAFAKVRLACLELPQYEGNNITHARAELALLKTELTAKIPLELAWACEVGSYAQHERTEEMLTRVRDFAKLYPQSRFLQGLSTAVREYQSSKIDAYFKANDYHGATGFFEANRARLYPKVSEELKTNLFIAYAEIGRADAAAEFWDAYVKSQTTDEDMIRSAIVAAELADKGKRWTKVNDDLSRQLLKREWATGSSPKVTESMQRIQATKAAHLHRPWLHKLTKGWIKQDVSRACDTSYPLLSQMFAEPSPTMKVADVAAEVTELIDKTLNDVFKLSPYCGYSLLELEFEVYRDRPTALAARYLGREYLPIDQSTAKIIWSLAESLREKGQPDLAQQLWRLIVTKGNEDVPEVRFAKSRLNNKKTQLEDLWQR